MSHKIPIIPLITIACVALGIFLAVQYRPTPEYWMEWRITNHLHYVAASFFAAVLVGLVFTRNLFRLFMLGLAGLFLAAGLTFWINAAFDSSPHLVLHFQVVQKDKVYEGPQKQAHWNYFLIGRTPEGRSFRFSTYASHISMATWQTADPALGSEILVEEHPGFLGIPWWIIR